MSYRFSFPIRLANTRLRVHHYVIYSSSILTDFDELMKHIHCQICSYYNLIMLHLVFSWKCIVTATLQFFKKEMNEHRVILILTVNTCLKNTILLIIKWSRQQLYCNSLVGVKLLLFIFLAFDFCLFGVVIRCFHPRPTANDPRLRRIFYPRLYPLHLFSYLNSQYFPLWMFSAKQGNYWYHF